MPVSVADTNSVVIGGLSVAKQYPASVRASTSARPGPFSIAETAPSEKSFFSTLYIIILAFCLNNSTWIIPFACQFTEFDRLGE